MVGISDSYLKRREDKLKQKNIYTEVTVCARTSTEGVLLLFKYDWFIICTCI